ncbi:MAG: hypothetical protein SO374_05790, partial [Eubacteriales bacterium]|nr:hypothetical protein [Eubacteriales bacterium]
WLSWSKAHDWKSCLRGTVTRVRIPFSAPKENPFFRRDFCFFRHKRERDEKGTAEQGEAKNHPVNGFLVPRAGGDTAPVSPDESLSLRQRKIPSFEGVFAFWA